MRSLSTAIIYLREPARPGVHVLLSSMLLLMRGVRQVEYVPAESLITVDFDHGETGLAEIVRTIEDAGPAVSSVAQRAA